MDDATRAARSNESLATLRVSVAIVADDEADRISALIENFRFVSHLEITYDEVDDDDDAVVGDPDTVDEILRGMCRSGSDLTELTLACSGGRYAIAEFAKRFPGITRLHLVSGERRGLDFLMPVSHDFSHGLAEAIGTWQNLSHLRHHVEGVRGDVDRVLAAIRACPTLAEMDVRLDHLYYDASARTADVCEVGAANESMRRLHIHVVHGRDDDPHYPDNGFFGFPQPLAPNLKAVSLQQVRFPAPDSLPLPLRVLGNATSLELHRCDFVDGAASLLYVLDSMPRLQELILDCRWVLRFTNDDIALFARWLPSHPTVTSVAISVNDPNPAVLLLQNCRGALRLDCSEFVGPEVRDLHRGLESANALLTSLTLTLGRCRLTRCRCRNVCLCRLGDWGLVRIFRIVASNRALEHLTLQLPRREDGDGIAPALAAMLHTNRTLRRLELTSVAVDLLEDVYDGISSGLAENQSIQHVSVLSRDRNDDVVPVSCLPELVRALQTNVTIRALDGLPLPSPDEHPLIEEALFLLKQNRFGRSFLWMEQPPAPIGLWARILANISEAGASDVMFHFLRAKLDLLGHRRTIAGRGEFE